MSRISDIILSARYSLADPDGDRWSDDRLLQLLDEGQKEIARRTNLLRRTITYDIKLGEYKVKLPDDFQAFDTALYNNKLLKIIDTFTLDSNVNKWEEKIGYPTFVVCDMNNKGEIELYPKPGKDNDLLITFDISNINYKYINENEVIGKLLSTDGLNNLDKFGFMVLNSLPDTGINTFSIKPNFGLPVLWFPVDFGVITWGENFGISNISEDFGFVNIGNLIAYEDILVNLNTNQYGVTTNIGDKEVSPYGAVSNIELDNSYFNDTYGFIVDIIAIDTNFKLRYIRKPKDIKNMWDELEVNESLNKALKCFIIGNCLRDDNDAQNRSVGNEWLQFFELELRNASIESSKNFMSTNRYYETHYNNGF